MRKSRFLMTAAGLLALSVVSATAQPNSSSTDRNATMKSGKTSEQSNGNSMKSTKNGYEQKQDVSGSGRTRSAIRPPPGRLGNSPSK